MKPIDYLPLNTPQEELHFKAKIDWRRTLSTPGGLLLLLGSFVQYQSPGNWRLTFTAIAGATFVFAVIIVFTLLIRRSFPKFIPKSVSGQVRLKAFAEANGFEFLQNTRLPQSGTEFRGEDGATECGFRTPTLEIGNYAYVAEQSEVRFGYVRLRLSREMPQIIFDSKKNNSFDAPSLAGGFDASSQVAIDTEFDALYDVYAPKDYEEAARTMARQFHDVLVQDGAAAFDMECTAFDVYLYHGEPFDFSEATVRQLLEMAEKLEAESSIQALPSGNEKLAVEHWPVGYKWLAGLFVAPFGLIYVAPYVQGNKIAGVIIYALLIGIAIAIVVVAIGLIRIQRKSRKKEN